MDQTNNTDKAAEAAPAPRAMSRRRFATAGLGSAGALLTIVSAPAMAQTATCATPSGTLSGDLYNSRDTSNEVICGGLSTEFYASAAGLSTWTTLQSKLFGAPGMFNCDGKNKTAATTNAKTFANSTLLELIQGQGFDKEKIGMKLATVYLNIALHKINFLEMKDLQTIWNEWQLSGTYTVRGGMKPWTTAEIVKYLDRTVA